MMSEPNLKTLAGSISLLGSRGYRLFVLPQNCPGGYALFEFEDGAPLDKTTYPTADGQAFYKPGDLIMAGELSLPEFRISFPEYQEYFPSRSPLTLLATALGQTQIVAWVILEIKPDRLRSVGHGVVQLQRTLFFGGDLPPAPTGLAKGYSVGALEENFRYERQYQGKRVFESVAAAVVSLSTQIATTGAKGAAELPLKLALKTLQRKFMRRAGIIFFANWMKEEGIQLTLRATKAFIQAFAQAYVILTSEGRIQNVKYPLQIDIESTKFHRALAAGTTAFVQALVDTAEGNMLKRFGTRIPERYQVAKNPSSWQAWVVTYVSKRFVKSISTGSLSKIVAALGQSLDGWIATGAIGDFSEYLEPEIINQLDGILKDELMVAVNGIFKLAEEAHPVSVE